MSHRIAITNHRQSEGIQRRLTLAVLFGGCVLLSGCLSVKQNADLTLSQNGYGGYNGMATNGVEAGVVSSANSGVSKPGQSSVTVEKMAMQTQGCSPRGGAELIASNGPTVEDYRVECQDGRELIAHCEYRQCAIASIAATATTLAGVPQTVAAAPSASGLSNPADANVAAVAPSQPEIQPEIQQHAPGQNRTAVPANPLKFVVALGVGSGGETLVTEYYTNNSTSATKAGSGAQLSIGFEDRLNEYFSAQATGGYQQESTNASNGNVRFSRFPLEFLGYYHLNGSWRVGGGLRLDINPKLSGAGAGSAVGTVDFNNATGAVEEVEYLFGQHFGLKLRGIQENFTQSGYSTKISGNQIGLFFDYYY